MSKSPIPVSPEPDGRIAPTVGRQAAAPQDHYSRTMDEAAHLPLIDPNTRMPVWAENLQRLTARSGLTQAELARRAGMQRDAYGRYALGKTRPPAAKLIAIAKVLGVDPREIDPDRDDLEEVAARDAGPMPFRLTPARGDGGKVFLEISAELDVATAMKIIEMMVKK